MPSLAVSWPAVPGPGVPATGCSRRTIFAPGVGGISHSPNELTRWQDCVNGANVLREAILQVDKM